MNFFHRVGTSSLLRRRAPLAECFPRILVIKKKGVKMEGLESNANREEVLEKKQQG